MLFKGEPLGSESFSDLPRVSVIIKIRARDQ